MQIRRDFAAPVRIAAGVILIAASGVLALGVAQQRPSLVSIGAEVGLAAAVALVIGAGPKAPLGGEEHGDER